MADPLSTPNPRRFAWPIALAAILILVFWPLATADYVRWDDPHNLFSNPDMNPPTLAAVGKYWTQWRTGYKHLYVPVTYTIWSILAKFAATTDMEGVRTLNPYVFHTWNLLLHGLSCLLVFAILSRLFCRGWAAFAGALLYGIHPVQVESVAWISGMKDLLGGLFSLAAIYFYLSFKEDPDSRSTWPKYLAAMLMLILAMLSKPSAVVTPLAALILHLARRDVPGRRSFWPLLPWFILVIPIALISRRVQPPMEHVFIPPIYGRPIVALDALGFYIHHTLAPLSLAFDYGRSPRWLWHSQQLYFTWIIPIAVAAGVFLFCKPSRLFQAGFLIFIACLAPVLGLVSFDFQAYSTTADHYLYLPMFGLSLMLASLFTNRLMAAPWKRVVLAIYLLALMVQSYIQTWNWRDSDALFTHTLQVNPFSNAANNNHATTLKAQGILLVQQGRIDEARERFDQAEQMYRRALISIPDDAASHRNLGNLMRGRNRFDEAIQHLTRSLEIIEESSVTHTDLAEALIQASRPKEAIPHLRRALELDPSNARARKILDGLP